MNTSVVLLRTTLDNIDEWVRQNKKITPDMYEHLNNIFQEAVDNGMAQSADSTQLTNRTTDYLSKQIHDRIHNQDTAETKKSKAVENLRKKLDAYDIFKKLNRPITLPQLNELRQLHEAAVEAGMAFENDTDRDLNNRATSYLNPEDEIIEPTDWVKFILDNLFTILSVSGAGAAVSGAVVIYGPGAIHGVIQYLVVGGRELLFLQCVKYMILLIIIPGAI